MLRSQIELQNRPSVSGENCVHELEEEQIVRTCTEGKKEKRQHTNSGLAISAILILLLAVKETVMKKFSLSGGDNCRRMF